MGHIVDRRPRVGADWLLGIPGEPRLPGTGIAPAASSQLPFRRSTASGQPCNQRALNRSVTV